MLKWSLPGLDFSLFCIMKSETSISSSDSGIYAHRWPMCLLGRFCLLLHYSAPPPRRNGTILAYLLIKCKVVWVTLLMQMLMHSMNGIYYASSCFRVYETHCALFVPLSLPPLYRGEGKTQPVVYTYHGFVKCFVHPLELVELWTGVVIAACCRTDPAGRAWDNVHVSTMTF